MKSRQRRRSRCLLQAVNGLDSKGSRNCTLSFGEGGLSPEIESFEAKGSGLGRVLVIVFWEQERANFRPYQPLGFYWN